MVFFTYYVAPQLYTRFFVT